MSREARGVDQRDAQAVDVDDLGHRSRVVPGTSVTIARCAPTSALNRLDLPTFGWPTIATCSTLANQPAAPRVAEQRVDRARRSRRSRRATAPARRSDSPRRENRPSLEPRDQIEQRRVDLARSRASACLQLIERRARLQRRHRVDQIGDRFGLRQIDAAVQKRAQRELAGLGEPRAARIAAATIASQHDRAAVRADLDDVFAGVRCGRGKVRDDDVIDRDRVRPREIGRERRVPRLERARRAVEQRVRDRACASGPLSADDTDPPRPGGVAIATMVSAVENMTVGVARSIGRDGDRGRPDAATTCVYFRAEM